jgi:hypothetical protein
VVRLVTGVVFAAYAIGALLGYAVARGGRLVSVWKIFIRANLLLTSIILSVLAGWRVSGFSDLVWPVVITAVMFVLVGIAYLLTPPSPERPGRAALRGWSAIPNPGFWLIPIATAIAGAPGAVIAVLIDRVALASFSIWVWVLRRHAPIKQQARTSWIDQSPLVALLVGLFLGTFSDAPEWTASVLLWLAPVVAAIGAAVFVGSALHPSQRMPWRPGVRVWALLGVARIAMLLPLAFLAPTQPIAVALVLGAFSIPAFFPSSLSVLYGYADPVVAASVRLGWVFAPLGLLAASLVVNR